MRHTWLPPAYFLRATKRALFTLTASSTSFRVPNTSFVMASRNKHVDYDDDDLADYSDEDGKWGADALRSIQFTAVFPR
jgi:hypothetical protein